MSPATEQILRAAMALPEEDRLELAEALMAPPSESGSESGGLPFDPEWLGEVARRSAEIDAGTVRLTPWSVVRERVHRRLEGLPGG